MDAQQIYEALERTVGTPMDLGDFMFHVTEALNSKQKLEYRFQGSLGFGGKLWINHRNPPYVTCYQEDQTGARKLLMELANQELLILYRSEQKISCKICEQMKKALMRAMDRLVNLGGEENKKVYNECEAALRLQHHHVRTNPSLDEALNQGDGTYKP